MAEKNIVTFEQVKAEVERIGFHLIAERPLTTHPADWYLRVVLARKETSGQPTEYAVWLFNGTRDTLNEGYYTKDRAAAFDKFDSKK